MTKRIKSLDGLRAFCAFGVIWIHVWIFYGNPSLNIASVNFYKLIAFVGNGVDFFFVISGFCMYLVLGGKKIDMHNSAVFIKKRALRILPAYYAAIIIYSLVLLYADPGYPVLKNSLYNMAFLQNFFPAVEISGPFWSIATEWHFYILLPFLFYMFRKFRVIQTTLAVMMLCLVFYLVVNKGVLNYDFWEKQIPVRFPEFGWGIIAGYLYKKNYQLKGFFSGVAGLCLGFGILYLGRFMKVTEVLQHFGGAGFVVKTAADTVMTFGFTLIMYLVITERSFLSRLLASRPILFLGKISYSLYLWHSLAIYFLTKFLASFKFGSYNPLAGFIPVALLSVLLATVSYYCFEYFYAKRSLKKEVRDVAVTQSI